MNRAELIKYIEIQYNADAEFMWESSPKSAVFRHKANRKWFALIMEVSRERLGLQGGGVIDIVNVKCPAQMIGSLLQEKGIFPAYHMNKANWLSIAPDDTASDDIVLNLLDISFELTAPGAKGRGKREGT